MTESLSQRQKDHYDNILDEYDIHYYDEASTRYRNRFIFDVLFKGMDLNGMRIADLASGSGHNSLAILKRFPQAETFGIDISTQACALYEKNVNNPSYCLDLTNPDITLPDAADVAIVVGGIHHCVANLEGTFVNLAKILKPGGTLLMVEPNADFALNAIRMFWYKKSKYFDDQTEAPLVHDDIYKIAEKQFDVEFCRFLGGASYFLTLNSLVTRTPLWLKNAIYTGLLGPEIIWNQVKSSAPHPYFAARWKRNSN